MTQAEALQMLVGLRNMFRGSQGLTNTVQRYIDELTEYVKARP